MPGFRGKADWLDMSDYLVHFTKTRNGVPAYESMMHILSEGLLRRGPGPFGAARRVEPVAESQRAVCFSETPLGHLHRFAEKYSPLGVAFRKGFVHARGGNPVWYVEKDTPTHLALDRMIAVATADVDHPIWKTTPFIDFPGRWNNRPYRFEWEREWRCPADVKFEVEDVAFLFVPEGSHAAARSFFDEAERENTGPNYTCPFIDPTWTVDRVRDALSDVPVDPPDDPDRQ